MKHRLMVYKWIRVLKESMETKVKKIKTKENY